MQVKQPPIDHWSVLLKLTSLYLVWNLTSIRRIIWDNLGLITDLILSHISTLYLLSMLTLLHQLRLREKKIVSTSKSVTSQVPTNICVMYHICTLTSIILKLRLNFDVFSFSCFLSIGNEETSITLSCSRHGLNISEVLFS